MVIGFSGTDQKEILNVSQIVYNSFKTNLEKLGINVFMPMPAPIDKIKNKYRWRIISKGNIGEEAIIIINKCLKNIYDSGIAKKTSIIVDVNPTNMM